MKSPCLFLVTAGFFTISLILPFPRVAFALAQQVEGTAGTEPYDVVIVGAGWAGLRAARVLLDKGIQNIRVLEANDYIGGRSKTLNGDGSINNPKRDMSNKPIEIGSEWLYMTGKADYLKKNDYLDNAYADPDGDAYFLTLDRTNLYLQTKLSDGSTNTRLLSNAERNDLERRVWGLFLDFREKVLDNYSSSDISYYAAAEAYKANYLSSNEDKQFLNLAVGAGKIYYGGETENLVLPSDDWLSGGGAENYYMGVPGAGFGNVAASFAAPFENKIQLNSKVIAVNGKDIGKNVITYMQNGEVKTISSKRVLIAVPLGVLKAGTINFTPKLPDWKQDAIDNMAFGVLNKCAMQWDDMSDIVWPLDQYWIQLITPDDESTGKWTTFLNPTRLKGVPTMIAWIGGDAARDIEKQTDEEILKDVMNNLRAMFPEIKQPDRVVISRWGQEENFLGTYSYETLGRDIYEDSANLQRNVVGRLFFAGEAAAGSTYGSTDAAWKSGEEAALGIVRSLKVPSNVQ